MHRSNAMSCISRRVNRHDTRSQSMIDRCPSCWSRTRESFKTRVREQLVGFKRYIVEINGTVNGGSWNNQPNNETYSTRWRCVGKFQRLPAWRYRFVFGYFSCIGITGIEISDLHRSLPYFDFNFDTGLVSCPR
ncbi:hypothetical protein D3C85_1487410 [compost metagenome]